MVGHMRKVLLKPTAFASFDKKRKNTQRVTEIEKNGEERVSVSA